MEIIIDNKPIEIFPDDKNIIDVADRAKIGIPAPCYRNNRNKGCCQICVVEINNELKYACCTKPADGMHIIVKREDLYRFRKEKARQYIGMPESVTNTCCCDSSDNSEGCCC